MADTKPLVDFSGTETEELKRQYAALGSQVENHQLNCRCSACFRFLDLGDELHRRYKKQRREA